eukprot:gene6795-8431_t
MSIYEDILRAQVKQGNFGGKKGPFAYLAEKKKKKPNKEIKYDDWLVYEITVKDAQLYVAHDSNGFSDPYVRIGKTKKDGSVFAKKWLLETPVIKKTLTPSWNYTDQITVNTAKSWQLTVELWDHDSLKDDLIGSTTYYPPTAIGGNETKKLEITDPKNDKIINGHLNIQVSVVERLSKDKFAKLSSSCV